MSHTSCLRCGHIPPQETIDLLQRTTKAIERFGGLRGWEAVDLWPEKDTDQTYQLSCPDCAATFTAEVEWFEFNDTGLPYTWQVTVKRTS